jgi:filamentous hemagglutinin family protein
MQEDKSMYIRQAERGFIRHWGSCLFLRPLVATLLIAGLVSSAHAAPEGGVVRAGSAQIVDQGSKTLIQQSSQRAIIDWRGFSINASEQVQFAQPSAGAATLNRVTGSQVSMILGRLDANGQVLLINPNGIIFGKGAQINVGSLIASTANLSNENFMQGKLIFDQPGKPGAGIVNSGSITAAEGGLVALVAPHVRNDGLIQARLGKVTLGAADTFTIDLYGDGLINLALTDASLAQLKDAQGQPVKSLITQAGTIDVGGGKAVLVTAEAAKSMLDSLINMSGTILADSAVQEGGRILLLAKGGDVDVSGNLSAKGITGGQIDVLGDQVHLAPTAKLDTDGTNGGGILHVGGAYQGSGDTYRAQSTQIDAGATLQANALTRGNGGEVVVWADGHTAYAGSIQARGGVEGGDGGLVEVSGKQTLAFNGLVDAGATNDRAGSLLLDPYNFTIGMAEASLLNRVLRTGTSASVSADNDIYVNYLIDGRGLNAGGGLTLSAGNDISVNDYIITNNGAISLYANSGAVTVAPGKVVYAGMAPITVRSGADLYNAPYLTVGLLSLISTQKSVFINQGIDSSIGNLFIQAAVDVNVNQPIISHSDGNSVNIVAGKNINVDGQIDGRPALGIYNGVVTMTAGQDINLYKSILANNINLTASLGTINAPTMKTGTVNLNAEGIPLGEGLFAGTGPISVTTGGNLSSGIYVTTGPVSIRSTSGNVNVDTKLAEILGNVTIQSNVGSVNVDQEIANIRSGSNLAIIAGTNINLNRQIDALDDTNPRSITPVPGGSVTFLTGNNVNLNKDLVTYDGPVNLTATNGTLNIAWNDADSRTFRIQSGLAPISVTTGGNLSTGTAPPTTFSRNESLYPTDRENILGELKRYVAFSTTGKLSLTSTSGDVTVDAPIPDTTGEVAITATNKIQVKHKVLSNNQPITLTASSGGIFVYGTNDNYGISNFIANPAINSGSGPLTLRAGGDISITTTNGIVTSNKLTVDTRSKILQGAVNQLWYYRPSEIELIADGGIDSFQAGYSPKISATSSNGAIHLDVYYPGELIINAPSPTAGDVFTGGHIGNKVDIHAGRDINLSNVDGGILKLTAGRDANLNTFEVTSLDVTASSIYFNSGGSVHPYSTLWLYGDLKATSTGLMANPDRQSTTGDILFNNYSAIHIDGGKSLALDAYKSVELGILESLGPVSVTARTGNITLRNDIGPPIQFYNPDTKTFYSPYDSTKDRASSHPSIPIYPGECFQNGAPSFDPSGIGVASLLLNAVQGNILMQGAKAAGTVTITAGGTLTPTKGIFSGTANGLSITATGGALEKIAGGPDILHFTFSGTSFGNIPLGAQVQLTTSIPVLPGITPGPAVSPPGLPGALTALPALPPGLAAVSGYALSPQSPDVGVPITPGPEQEVEANRLAGNVQLSEIIPVEDEAESEEETRKKILKISYGHSATQVAELGIR